jgi:hypothetical protein
MLVNPASRHQRMFFAGALRERAGQPYAGKKYRGAHYDKFVTANSQVPSFARERLKNLAQTVLTPELQPQTVEGLAVPRRFRQQGDNSVERTNRLYVTKACMNACFRMIFDDITGWTTDETALRTAIMNANQNEHQVEDYRYLDIFHTEHMKQLTPRKIETCYIKGGDFDLLGRVALKAQPDLAAGKPGADIYCVATTGKFSKTKLSGESMTIHDMVLLGVSEDTVTVHDPAYFHPQESREIPKDEFIGNWALANNTAMLVIAHNAPVNA